MNEGTQEKAIFAAGCFWCYEAIYLSVRGVSKVTPGYTGGDTPNPSYELVCTGTTGHAEAIEVTYDPQEITYAELLDIFWHMHNPTTLNRQGNDVGTQYRSAIFYLNAEQKKIALESKAAVQGDFEDPIVTEITELQTFYPAEDYHHNYYNLNQNSGYCQLVITPKLSKLKQKYSQKVK